MVLRFAATRSSFRAAVAAGAVAICTLVLVGCGDDGPTSDAAPTGADATPEGAAPEGAGDGGSTDYRMVVPVYSGSLAAVDTGSDRREALTETFDIWKQRLALSLQEPAPTKSDATQKLADSFGMSVEEYERLHADVEESMGAAGIDVPPVEALLDPFNSSVITEQVTACGDEAAVSLYPVVRGEVPAFSWRSDIREAAVPDDLAGVALHYWEAVDPADGLISVAWVPAEFSEYAILVTFGPLCDEAVVMRSIQLEEVQR